MQSITYKKEDIDTVIKALNSLTVRGIENNRLITYIAETLSTLGEVKEEEVT